MTAIREEDVLAALRELESTRWEEVLDFIGYLRHRIKPTVALQGTGSQGEILTGHRLATSDLVGLWSDRIDLPDSPEVARHLRHQAEQVG